MQLRKIVATALVAVVIAATQLGVQSVPLHASAASLSTIQQKQKEIQQKINASNKALKDLEGKAEKEEAYQAELDKQIEYSRSKVNLLKEKISVLGDDIETKDQEITEKLSEIDQKQVDIDESYETFKTRMRAMYMAGETSSMELLFSAQNFGDFLTNIELMQAISASDQKLVETLKQQKVDLETEKTTLEGMKTQLESDKKSLEEQQADVQATQASLEKSYQKSKTAQQSYESMEEQYSKNLKAALAEEKKVQAELDAFYAELARKNKENQTVLADGKFIWPVPGFSNISSPYGPRWGGFHSGMDISGGGKTIYGSNIVASSSGTVVLATSHYSYGNYIIVDHGGGYTTLYAHASSLLVGVGQKVEKGQAIAKVGSTGNSTGPHLHFEVRINGKTQNPQNYVRY